jgi:hypothetical protein
VNLKLHSRLAIFLRIGASRVRPIVGLRGPQRARAGIIRVAMHGLRREHEPSARVPSRRPRRDVREVHPAVGPLALERLELRVRDAVRDDVALRDVCGRPLSRRAAGARRHAQRSAPPVSTTW